MAIQRRIERQLVISSQQCGVTPVISMFLIMSFCSPVLTQHMNFFAEHLAAFEAWVRSCFESSR